MNNRERVISSINHNEPDRVPIDFGGSMVTSIHKIAYENLKKYLDINQECPVKIARGRSLVSEVDFEIANHLDTDTAMLIAASPDGWLENLSEQNTLTDEWGIEWDMPDGFTNYEIVKSPLWGEISLNDITNFKWPNPYENMLPIEGIRKRAEYLRNSTDKAVIANVAFQIHTQSYFLRGFSDYLMDMMLQPDVITAIMDGVLEVFVERAKIIMNEIGDFVDIIYVADDLGSQSGPLFSPDLYRKLLKPRQKILFDTLKKNHDVKILYHTCGSVVDFIPDLIEVGVDILNPVQTSASGMEADKLKKEFGKDICFWGGIDTQQVLPFGSPQDVKDEVKRKIESLASGGGYVVAAIHNIRPEVPPENIIAMIEAAKEYGKY